MKFINDKKEFWIFGFGRFGQMAATRLINNYPQALLKAIDRKDIIPDPKMPIEFICSDASNYLAENLTPHLGPSFIIPAVPFHLAYGWVKTTLQQNYHLIPIPIPDPVLHQLPNSIPGKMGTLYSSYASFLCPDNCPEPEKVCTVTGRQRTGLLYQDYRHLNIDGYLSLGIRSYQLAPGVGGFKPEDLWGLLKKIQQTGTSIHYLLSTACLCHGVMDSFRLEE